MSTCRTSTRLRISDIIARCRARCSGVNLLFTRANNWLSVERSRVLSARRTEGGLPEPFERAVPSEADDA